MQDVERDDGLLDPPASQGDEIPVRPRCSWRVTGVYGDFPDHFLKFHGVKEIHEPVASYGEAQFVEDRMHPAGAFDFVSGGVPLPEDFEVGCDVPLIPRVQGGPGQAIHPAEVMEAVFGLIAEPGVERDRPGEVDFDLSELPPTPVDDGVRQVAVRSNPGPELLCRTRKWIDRIAPGEEMPPPDAECLIVASRIRSAQDLVEPGAAGVKRFEERGIRDVNLINSQNKKLHG